MTDPFYEEIKTLVINADKNATEARKALRLLLDAGKETTTASAKIKSLEYETDRWRDALSKVGIVIPKPERS